MQPRESKPKQDPPNEGVDAGKRPIPRSNEHPKQTAEVPLGTGDHAEPPGGGGRPAQRREK
jgi:hypothetical protein